MHSFETSFPFSQQLFLGLLCVSEFTPTSFSMFAAHSIVCMYISQFDQPFINKADNSYLVCIPLFFFLLSIFLMSLEMYLGGVAGL